MIAIAIIATILLIIIFLLSSRIKIQISYSEDIKVIAKYLFFKKPVYPKQEKLKISDYKYKKYKKKLLKKKKKKSDEKNETVKQPENKKKSIVNQLKLLIYIVKKIYKKLFNKLRIDVKYINITVASDNAAKTAVLYGIVYQSVDYLLAFINENTRIKQKKAEDICITTNYLTDKTIFDINLVFSMSVFSLLDIGMKMTYNYLVAKYNSKPKNK